LDLYSNGFISVYDAEMFGILRFLIAVNYCGQIIIQMTRHQLVYTVLSVNLWFVTATRLTEIGPFLRSKSKVRIWVGLFTLSYSVHYDLGFEVPVLEHAIV
jgi:hypothetical protein